MKKFWDLTVKDMELPLQIEFYKNLRSLGYQGILISYVSIFAALPTLALKYDGDLEAIMKFIGRLGICPLIFVTIIICMPIGLIQTANYELNKLYIRNKRQKIKNGS